MWKFRNSVFESEVVVFKKEKKFAYVYFRLIPSSKYILTSALLRILLLFGLKRTSLKSSLMSGQIFGILTLQRSRTDFGTGKKMLLYLAHKLGWGLFLKIFLQCISPKYSYFFYIIYIAISNIIWCKSIFIQTIQHFTTKSHYVS